MKIKNKYLNNLFKLTSSSALAQLILIISSPILTRLYSPNDFGVFALFVAIVGILSVISSLRYEQAIIIPKSDNKAIQLIYVGLLINIVFFVILFIILFFFAEYFFNLFGIGNLLDYYWIIPIAVFFIGCFQLFNYWLIRNQKFDRIAKIKIQQSLLIVTIQLIFYKLGAVSLTLGHSFGQLLGVVKNGSQFLKNTVPNRFEMFSVVQQYKKFPIYSTWSALLNSIGAQLPVLIFTAYYSPIIAGLYMLTQRVIQGPLSIIGQAITQIFISNIRHEEGKLKLKLIYLTRFLMAIAIIPFGVIVVAGDRLFSIVFGVEWAEAGTIAKILSPWLLLVFICSPISSLLEYKNKQVAFLVFQINLFFFRLLSFYIGYLFLDSYLDTLVLFSALSSLCWLVFLLYVFSLYDINISEWVVTILKKFIPVFFIFIFFIFFNFDDSYYWFFLLIAIILSLIVVYEKGFLKDES